MQTIIKSKTDESHATAQDHIVHTNAMTSSIESSANRSCESLEVATTFGSSTTRSSSLAKTSSTSSVQSDVILFNISNLVSNSSSSSSVSTNNDHLAPTADVSKRQQQQQLVCHADGKPIAAPRIKKIGSSSVTAGLSHQLSQLRRIYEAAELDSLENELVDNEVQLYLGGGGGVGGGVLGDEPKGADKANTELSGSWSRVRAQRILMEQQGDIIGGHI